MLNMVDDGGGRVNCLVGEECGSPMEASGEAVEVVLAV